MFRKLLPVAFLAACGDGTGPTVNFEALSLSIVRGDAQRDTVTKELPTPLEVQVMDGANPALGVIVNFVPDADCGAPFVTAVATNATGLASNRWTLGTVAGACGLEARAINDVGQPVTFARFTADAIPGPVVNADLGGGWSTFDVDTLDLQQGVQIRDQWGNVVHWRVTVSAFARVLSNDSTNALSRMIVGDSVALQQPNGVGVALATISYGGQVLCNAELRVSANGQDGLLVVVEAPRSQDGGCASSI